MKTNRFLSILSATVLAAVSTMVTIPQTQTVVKAADSGPVSYYGELQASGNQIIGAKTQSPAQVKGMSFFWSNWGGQYWNGGTVDRMVDEFKCEILRCSIGVDEDGRLYDGGDVNKLRSIVETAITRDIYVIVDWHSHGAHNNVNEAKSFFNDIARDYGKYDNVIFEVYNEPMQISWDTVKNYATDVISTIRQYSDNLVLVGTPTWSQDVDYAAQNPINDANVAYVLHFYAGTHGGDLRSKGDSAMNSNAAVFVSEWGTVNADGDGSVNYNSTAEWLSWMDSHKLSWCNWAINNKAEGSSIFSGDGSSLTEAGTYLKKILNEHAETAEWRNAPAVTTTTVTTEYTQEWQNTTTATTPSEYGSGEVISLPGTLEAENYTEMSGIQLEDCEAGGQNVGYIEDGDWLTYRIQPAQNGTYSVELLLASESTGGTFTLESNGNVLTTISAPVTGGWQNWERVTAEVNLPAGESTLKINVQQGGFNIDKLIFSTKAVEADLSGDVNHDGKVSISDAVLLARFVNEEPVSISAIGRANAECDGDSILSMNDAAVILKYIARLIRKLPASV